VLSAGCRSGDLGVEYPAEKSALVYLSREVAKWPMENHCFSCHNNGDGARFLFQSEVFGFSVSEELLETNRVWLSDPDAWDFQSDQPEAEDPRLARIQFAFAFTESIGNPSPELAGQVSALLKEDQHEDGSWKILPDYGPGSPVTYGTYLATAVSVRSLQKLKYSSNKAAIQRAEQWLMEAPIKNVYQAASVLFGIGNLVGEDPDKFDDIRLKCLEMIRQGQSSEGGWGPFLNAAAEPFDTALVLYALMDHLTPDHSFWEKWGDRIRRGRDYLLESQLEGGGWIETTRPQGYRSYAQHISTSSWAASALIKTSAYRR
jgi:hypothetical protein